MPGRLISGGGAILRLCSPQYICSSSILLQYMSSSYLLYGTRYIQCIGDSCCWLRCHILLCGIFFCLPASFLQFWPHFHVPALLIISLSLQHCFLFLLLQLVLLQFSYSVTGLDLHRKLWIHLFLKRQNFKKIIERLNSKSVATR